MKHPWMQFYTRDWLDNKELRRCTLEARSVLVDLLCIAHEGYPYGYLADKLGALTDMFLSSRCIVSQEKFSTALRELIDMGCIRKCDETGILFFERMVSDHQLREKKSKAGKAGGSPLLKQVVNQAVNQVVNQVVNHSSKQEVNHSGYPRSDSDSNSCFKVSSEEFDYESSFEELWNAYPQKGRTRRPLCQQTYIAKISVSADATTLHADIMAPLAETGAWAQSEQWGKGFIMALADYLVQERWRESPAANAKPVDRMARMLAEAEELDRQEAAQVLAKRRMV